MFWFILHASYIMATKERYHIFGNNFSGLSRGAKSLNVLNHTYSFDIIIRALIQVQLCTTNKADCVGTALPWKFSRFRKFVWEAVDTGQVILSCLGSTGISVSGINFFHYVKNHSNVFVGLNITARLLSNLFIRHQSFIPTWKLLHNNFRTISTFYWQQANSHN